MGPKICIRSPNISPVEGGRGILNSKTEFHLKYLSEAIGIDLLVLCKLKNRFKKQKD